MCPKEQVLIDSEGRLTLMPFVCDPIRINSLFMLLVKCWQNLYDFDSQPRRTDFVSSLWQPKKNPKFIESNDYVLIVTQLGPFSDRHGAFSSSACVTFSDRDPCPVPSAKSFWPRRTTARSRIRLVDVEISVYVNVRLLPMYFEISIPRNSHFLTGLKSSTRNPCQQNEKTLNASPYQLLRSTSALICRRVSLTIEDIPSCRAIVKSWGKQDESMGSNWFPNLVKSKTLC